MHTLTSDLNKSIITTHDIKAGTIYIFDKFAISEFKEGILLDFDSFLEIYNILDIYSKDSSTFGYISNRINSYTVNVLDFFKARKLANKRYPMAVITYSKKNKGVFLFEKQLYNCDAQHFSEITKAANWLDSKCYSLN